MRWIGLISKPGSSPLTLIKWFRGCLRVFGQHSVITDRQVVRVMVMAVV